MNIPRFPEIEHRIRVSGRDCMCHSMKTCPDMAQSYWDYYDEDVPTLLRALKFAITALREFEAWDNRDDGGCSHDLKAADMLEEINNIMARKEGYEDL